MNFLDIKDSIRLNYSLPSDDIVRFYSRIMPLTKRYDRCAGFFSSSALYDFSKGLYGLIKNKGKMRLITSPNLQENDIQEIRTGYDQRKINELMGNVLTRSWTDPETDEEKWRLNLLSNLIADGYLDIKVAFMKNPIGLYHEKIGIFTDNDGNSVSFIGSMNESAQAMSRNYESVEVFTSWGDGRRNENKISHFNELWSNLSNNLEVVEFPEVALEKLRHYQTDNFMEGFEKYEKPFTEEIPQETVHETVPKENVPALPQGRELREYQVNAIKEWSARGYKGIFNMATGTGKTYTGLGALVNLYKHCDGNLAVIICCPYILLVEQWMEDLRLFNIDPIAGYSSSEDRDWLKSLKRYIEFHNTLKDFFCFITTYDSFFSDKVQNLIKHLNENTLLIADEAHHMGSTSRIKKLPSGFAYRLGLSATIKRHRDEEGTKAIYDYFGGECITYTLGEAIGQGMLTEYDYHPVIVYLTDEELTEYKDISRRIAQLWHGSKTKEPPQAVKSLLIKRSRIIAGAAEKNTALIKAIAPYKNQNYLLVYCGSTKVDDFGEGDDGEGVRQIDYLCKRLWKELGIKVAMFTSRESPSERQVIKERFSSQRLQALAAIKCLDEGFNIPGIRVAFILASTTNPKEYIQRLGRVLRLAEGKEYAEIYDFVTLPRPLAKAAVMPIDEQGSETSLVRNEIERMEEFNSIARNKIKNDKLIWDMRKAYNIHKPADQENE